MAVYVLARTIVHDAAALSDYGRLAGPSVKAFGGRVTMKGSVVEVLEGGKDVDRVAVLEFESADVARRWYASPEYAAAIAARQGVAEMQLTLVE